MVTSSSSPAKSRERSAFARDDDVMILLLALPDRARTGNFAFDVRRISDVFYFASARDGNFERVTHRYPRIAGASHRKLGDFCLQPFRAQIARSGHVGDQFIHRTIKDHVRCPSCLEIEFRPAKLMRI